LSAWSAKTCFTVEQDIEYEKYKIRVVCILLSLISMYNLASAKQLALEISSDIRLVSDFYKAISLNANAKKYSQEKV